MLVGRRLNAGTGGVKSGLNISPKSPVLSVGVKNSELLRRVAFARPSTLIRKKEGSFILLDRSTKGRAKDVALECLLGRLEEEIITGVQSGVPQELDKRSP